MEHTLIPFLKRQNWKEVLEVGSKDARYKKYMEFDSYTTLDIEASFHPDIVADVEWYESNRKYDTILICQCLEHIKQPDIAVKRMYELLKPSGRIICTVPFIFAEHGQDFNRWTEQGLRLLFGRYFNKVSIIPYGNFVSSSWQIFNFHNKFWILNKLVVWFSRITFSNKYCPDGFLIEAIK
jgi:SAM-dependent methyltransferase